MEGLLSMAPLDGLRGVACTPRRVNMHAMALTSSITSYDQSWPRRYVEAVARLAPIFEAQLLGMHHVGSTAVPGLAAKPEIDILAIVTSTDTPLSWTEKLEKLGYRRGGDLTVGHRFFKRDVYEVRTHKVHICTVGHPSIERMLRFRDHLRSHPEDRARYDCLKRQLERANTAGISEYLAGKRPFIEEVLGRIGGA